jgi:ribonuclease P protein component
MSTRQEPGARTEVATAGPNRTRVRTASSETLARSEIVRRQADIDRLMRSGRKVAGSALVLRSLPRPEHPSERRVALLVSRRVGGAVTRNRVKRRLREIFRRNKSWFAPGFDYALLPGPAAGRLDFPELKEATRTLASRLTRDE